MDIHTSWWFDSVNYLGGKLFLRGYSRYGMQSIYFVVPFVVLVTATGATSIANALKTNGSLLKLNLSGKPVSVSVDVEIVLTFLSLENFIDDAGANAIVEMLKVNSSVMEINLSCKSYIISTFSLY